MLDKVIYFVISSFPLCMCILSLLIALSSRNKFNQRLFACLLFLQLVLVESGALLCMLSSSITTNNIGWKPSPFEFEIAVANLALGVAESLLLLPTGHTVPQW